MILSSDAERYEADIPDGAVVLTAGVDVQDDRFEIEITGWGRGYESWGIKYDKIFGDLEKKKPGIFWKTILIKNFTLLPEVRFWSLALA